MLTPNSKMIEFLWNFGLSICQSTLLYFELSLSLTADSSRFTTTGTFDSDLLHVKTHHVTLEYASNLSEGGRTPTDKHGPGILKPGEF
jgi:hypothetical protein